MYVFHLAHYGFAQEACQSADTKQRDCASSGTEGLDDAKNNLLFLPSSSCTPSAFSSRGPASTTTIPLPFPPFPFPTSLVPPKPDSTGSAIGIPIPLPPPRSSTLPPLPAGTSAVSKKVDKCQAQYRKIFVPSTVIHNGVVQQMLVPMMCLLAPVKTSDDAAPSHACSGPSLPLTLRKPTSGVPSANMPKLKDGGSKVVDPGKNGGGARRRASQSCSPSLSVKTESLKKGAHYRTRSTIERQSPRAGLNSEDSCPTDALSMLADAALMQLNADCLC
jgi:hypothetical protein